MTDRILGNAVKVVTNAKSARDTKKGRKKPAQETTRVEEPKPTLSLLSPS